MDNEQFQAAVIKQLSQQALDIAALKHLLLKKSVTPTELKQAEAAAMKNLDTVQHAMKKAMGLI